MIAVDEALERIARTARALPAETVPLAEAEGRVLAEPARARLTHPARAVSAMDGYAVRRPHPCPAGTRFTVIGEAPAGRPFAGSVAEGEAVRLFTGSVLPQGADHVVIQEEAAREDGAITLTEEQPEARFVRPAGGDFSDGETLLPEGTALGPVDLALLAAAGLASVAVHKRPRIALFANGDELVEPGEAPGPGQAVNSTPYALPGLIRSFGGDPLHLGRAGDSPEAVGARFDEAARAGADVAVPIGGASVGDYDFVRAEAKARYDLVFERVAVRPGKPVWFAKGEAGCALGLPGNPSSSLACALLFLKPLIHALTGRDAARANRMLTARLTRALPPGSPREHYMRARIAVGADGVLEAAPQARQDTSLLTPFAASNALLRRPARAPAAEAGDPVPVLLFGTL
ncbi:molybdopterin molybdotransferase MoeA [Parvularcula oceani]|uniref:molybdopterin molybdotransferase MoeA n=1 Tax=Parvularcula oceani TaxID=1247963 RepID=UPI0004E17BCF|nr:molybdopterin molybdotransferase MoeA [Parvularcula oceani]